MLNVDEVIESLKIHRGGKALALDHIPDTIFSRTSIAQYI